MGDLLPMGEVPLGKELGKGYQRKVAHGESTGEERVHGLEAVDEAESVEQVLGRLEQEGDVAEVQLIIIVVAV